MAFPNKSSIRLNAMGLFSRNINRSSDSTIGSVQRNRSGVADHSFASGHASIIPCSNILWARFSG